MTVSEATLVSRRESSKIANRRRRAAESTVVIPRLSEVLRRKRRQLEADPEAWIWEMCGPRSHILEPLSRLFTSQQAEMIHAYQETLSHGGDELLLASRGEGKTTYLRAMIWKSIADGSIDFAAFVSATGPDANNSCEAIRDMIQRSETFLKLYPEVAIPCRRVGSTPQLARTMLATGYHHDDPSQYFEQCPISFSWSAEGLDFPDVPGSPSARSMMRFKGADSPIRGLNVLGRRPKVIAIDDLDTPETVNNPDVARKVIDRVDTDIGGLGTQTEPLARLMLATLPKQGCGVAHHYARVGHPFVVKRFKYLIEKPIRWDMWMEYVKLRQKGKQSGDKYGRKAHRFYLSNQKEMDAGVKVANEYRFKAQELPDGSLLQVSAVQNYFDEWADKGEMFCRCELDNELIETQQIIESQLELGHIYNCQGELPREIVADTTGKIVRGIDVRKIELHHSTMSVDDLKRHRIIDYNVRGHGNTETSVEQAERLILEALHRLADDWDATPYRDEHGTTYRCDLTLIDKGWKGSWTEDGEIKTWASQPVETFCRERGLRHWLPAKGQPNYRSPEPSEKCIVGDNWHMNKGEGIDRGCTEVIWNTDHWHALVEDLFLLPKEDDDRFELFVAEEGVWKNHSRFAQHIHEGAHERAENKRKATRTRKPRYRRDHWWDSSAMMLVADSIENWFRENLVRRPRRQSTGRPLRLADSEELGAR